MAIAIVEELWTRIRAAIDDKIVAATTAAESAEADRVVVEQAAMSASWSGDRLTVLGAMSPQLTGPQGPEGPQGPKGDSGDGTGDVLWSELNPALDGKADVGHTHTPASIGAAAANHVHTSANITDAQHYVGGAAWGGKVVKTHTNGHIYVREDPPSPDAVPRKQYVDDQVAANKGYVDARTPEIRVVSTIPASPTPGVVYMRFG